MSELTLFSTEKYTTASTGFRDSTIDARGHDPSWDEPDTPVEEGGGDGETGGGGEKSDGTFGDAHLAIAPTFSVDEAILASFQTDPTPKSDIAIAMAVGETLFKIKPAIDRLCDRTRLVREGRTYRPSSTEKSVGDRAPAVVDTPPITPTEDDNDARWNPEDFGEPEFIPEPDGQLTIATADDESEPPEPDDHPSREKYDRAWNRWQKKPSAPQLSPALVPMPTPRGFARESNPARTPQSPQTYERPAFPPWWYYRPPH